MSKQSRIVLGHKIKESRKRIGLSQKDFARYLNVTDKSVSSYEVGRSSPSLSVLKKISLIVHQPLSYFDDKATLSREELLKKLQSIEADLKEVKRLMKKLEL